ncbi:MAG: phosphopantothenate synthase, partial [Leptolyngbyaceae cyanobacterium SM1_4_3]|nr:phosphopantothenate synthase [Leptolyngbyaceae cyanobacterium SM1_4_3]
HENCQKRSLPHHSTSIARARHRGRSGDRKRPHQRLIGFAAQTGDIVPPALEKLQRKQLDAIAANPVDQPNSGFGGDQNQAIFLDKSGNKQAIAPCSKLEMAHYLLDFVQGIV